LTPLSLLQQVLDVSTETQVEAVLVKNIFEDINRILQSPDVPVNRSKNSDVDSGIPQNSLLGPVLFIMYIVIFVP